MERSQYDPTFGFGKALEGPLDLDLDIDIDGAHIPVEDMPVSLLPGEEEAILDQLASMLAKAVSTKTTT